MFKDAFTMTEQSCRREPSRGKLQGDSAASDQACSSGCCILNTRLAGCIGGERLPIQAPAVAALVGALRLHPHEHYATYLPQEIEDLREASASSPIVLSILGHDAGLASHREVRVRTEPLP
jgi:hypothetical protein